MTHVPTPPRVAAAVALVLAVASTVRGQLGFQDPAFAVAASNSISLCEPAPAGSFALHWKAEGVLTGATTSVTLPVGASYVEGSHGDLATSPAGITSTPSVDGATITFTLGDLPDGATGTIGFRLAYDCGVLASFSTANQLTLAADANEQGQPFTLASPAINATLAEPQFLLETSAASDVDDAVLGQTYPRSFDIRQTGVGAEVNAFELCVRPGADLATANWALEGVPLGFSGGDCVALSREAHPGLPWPLSQNDRWTFTEDVTPTACAQLGTEVELDFGCGGGDCGVDELADLTVTLADDAPVLTLVTRSRTLPSDNCLAEGALMETEWELTGRLFDPRMRMIAAASDIAYVDAATVEVNWGAGYQPYTGGFREQTFLNGCDQTVFSSALTETQPIVIDATAAPVTLGIRYRTRVCCDTEDALADPATDIYGNWSEVKYEDKCGTTSFTPDGYQNPLLLRAGGSLAAPAYLADGATSTFTVDVTNSATDPALKPTAYHCARIRLDESLTPDLAAGLSWRGGDGQPVFNRPLVDLGGGEYEACFPAGEAYAQGSRFEFVVDYACSPTSAGRDASHVFALDVFVGRESACAAADDCGITLFTTEAQTLLGDQCTATCVAGVSHLGASVERSCFGAPDNDRDGCADGSGAVDRSVVRADRAVEGDEVAVASSAVVVAPTGSPAIDELLLELTAQRDHLPGADARLTVVDASSGATYTCGGTAAQVVDARTLRFAFPAVDLQGCGDFPADFALGDGDSLLFEAGLVVASNPACGLERVAVTPAWTVRLGGSADEVACNGAIPASYTHVGYRLSAEPRARESYGCSGLSVDLAGNFCIGGTNSGIPFPGEYRPLGRPTEGGIEVSPGTSFERLELRYAVWPTNGASDNGVTTPTDVTAFASVVDGYVVMDWDAYFANCAAEPRLGGAGWEYVLRAYFQGSCSVEAYDQRVFAEAELTYCAAASTVETSRDERSFGAAFQQVSAELSLRSAAPNVAPLDDRAVWRFSVLEGASARAENAYVAFRSASGLIIPEELRLGGASITPSNGIYPLGSIAAGGLANLELTARFGDCVGDELIVYTGWDCSGYPASASTVASGAVACAPDSLTLGLRAGTTGIQQRITGAPPTRSAACEDQFYELELINTTNTAVFSPVLEMIVPFDEGIEIVAADGAVAYPSPSDPGDADFAFALGAPASSERTAAGISLRWNLESGVAAFDPDAGAGGWAGLASGNDDDRRVSVRIAFRTNCAFIAGDYVSFRTYGTTYCGTEVRTSLVTGAPINYLGVAPPYEITHSLAAPATLPVCGDGETSFNGVMTLAGATDGADTLLITLPAGLHYGSLTSDDDVVDASSAAVRRIGPIGNRGIYLEEVALPIAGGVSFRDVNYTLTTLTAPDDLLCGEPGELRVRSVRRRTFTCRAETCNSLITTGQLLPTPRIDLVIDSFALSAPAVAVVAEGGALVLEGVEVTNLGASTLSHPLTLTLYVDADGDGAVGPGDEALGAFTATGSVGFGATAVWRGDTLAVPAGTEPCGLLVEAGGCGCQRAVGRVGAVRFANAGPDAEVCAGQPVSIGRGDDRSAEGYTYSWSPLGGAPVGSPDDPSSAATAVTTVNDGATPITAEFVLTTTSPAGCSSADTIALTVLPSCRRIGDFVWVDFDANGLQDPGEPGLAGVTVELIDANTPVSPIAFTLTDAAGRYAFDDYPAGDYRLRFDPSTSAYGESYTFTEPNAGEPLRDSDAGPGGLTAVFTYDPTVGPRADLDAGVRPAGRLAAVLSAPSFAADAADVATATLHLGLANLGEGELAAVAVDLPLAERFGAAFVGIVGEPTVIDDGGLSGIRIADGYDGAASPAILAASDAVSLPADGRVIIAVRVAFDAAAASYPVLLQASAEALAEGPEGAGATGALRSSDLSDGGTDFAGTNPGAPGDLGTADDPLAISCAAVEVQLALDEGAECPGSAETLRLTQPFGEAARYEWREGGEVISTDPLPELRAARGTYTLQVRVMGADSTCLYGGVDEVVVESGTVPQGFSPNDDGVNDLWRIPCLAGFQGASVSVFNRWGNRVFAAEDYRAAWDGSFGGEVELPDGTYFYIVEPPGDGEPLAGYVEVRR